MLALRGDPCVDVVMNNNGSPCYVCHRPVVSRQHGGTGPVFLRRNDGKAANVAHPNCAVGYARRPNPVHVGNKLRPGELTNSIVW